MGGYLTCQPEMAYYCHMRRRWLDPDEEAAWRAYRRLNRVLYAELARDLTRETGLSDPDYEVLSTLTEKSPSSWRAAELSTQLQWSTSRLAHHVSRMEQRGLVRREPYEDDGRGAVIHLTQVGREAIKRAAPSHVAAVRYHFVDRLTPEQLRALREIAEVITAQLDDEHRIGVNVTQEAVGG
jgi:DNA-binding MarR family transcriptional regulator